MTDPDALDRARDPRTPPDQLARLARRATHEGASVRLAVAANPSASRGTVEAILGATGDGAGAAELAAVLGNPSLPLWLLEDPTWLHRQPLGAVTALARSPALTPVQWEALHWHASPYVRLLLLRSPVAPPDAWHRLSLDAEGAWDLSGSGIDGDDLEYLARHPVVTAVTRLDLGGNRLRDGGLRALFCSPNFPRLTALDLSDNGMSAEAICALTRSTSFPALTELRLCRHIVNGRTMEALARSSHLPRLTRLHLQNCFLVDADVIELARTTAYQLTLLDLAGNQEIWDRRVDGMWEDAEEGVGDAGAIALSQSASLAGLTHLDLSSTLVGDEGALALTRAAFFPRLTVLRLPGHRMTPGGRDAVRAAAASIPGLTLEL